VKIMVVSDTHGALLQPIINAMKKEENVDVLIHCGDKFKDAELLSKELGIKTLYRVPGNCDFDTKHKSMLFLELQGKYVLITHGHLQHVKDGMEILKKYAEDNHADIVLFGHTHKSFNEWDKNILYFNPGSTILPKEGKASFGIINLLENEITSRLVDII